MPRTEFHINKAKRNEDFYLVYKLETSVYNEWAVVVLFYTLLHYVDAILNQDTNLSADMQNPKNHKKRKRAIALCSQLDPISTMYLNLCDRCWEARYYKLHFPDDYFNNLVSRVYKPTHEHLIKCLNLS